MHILARKKVKDVIFCLHINIFFAIIYKCLAKGITNNKNDVRRIDRVAKELAWKASRV